jgi:isoleucyl-tRNA synthetase
MEAIPSYAALLAKPGIAGTDVFTRAKAANPQLSDDLAVHKPYIDAVTYDSPFAGGSRMRRVPEVIDCWFDSGAMPFAQWGWPHSGTAEFEAQFPADFISEAIDQTRGWFYSQLAISTLLFGRTPGSSQPGDTKTPYPHPFRTCIVLGHMLGEDGQKMSKSRRNYKEPKVIFDTYGADALRWYFLAGQPPWTSIRYNERAIRESIPEFLLRLWNVYSFFVIYARIDGFDPAGLTGSVDDRSIAVARGGRAVSDYGELDRWMLSEVHATAIDMVGRLDAFDHFGAAQRLSAAVSGSGRPAGPMSGRRATGTSSTPTGRSTRPCSRSRGSPRRSCRSCPRRSGAIWPSRGVARALRKASTSRTIPSVNPISSMATSFGGWRWSATSRRSAGRPGRPRSSRSDSRSRRSR